MQWKKNNPTHHMRGHLVIFAKILSSNQVLWDSFSPLEKNRRLNKDEFMQGTKDGTDENKQVKKPPPTKY